MFSQESEKQYQLNGYISDMQSATFDSINKNWSVSNLIHNRINFKLYTGKLTTVAEMRNRFIFGENLNTGFNSTTFYETDNGYMDLSKNVFDGKSYVLNLSLDRLYLAYDFIKLNITLGRQRINWGQTLVWNPNDIFNAYSFFDFDYVERPGSDALRLQYYGSEVSSSEFAIKLNSEKQITAALFHKINFKGYDVQFLAGILNDNDLVLGTGWSGSVFNNFSFRGEVSYFTPRKSIDDSSSMLIASLSTDYTFGNSLMIVAEYLYSQNDFKGSSILELYNAPQNVKNLSPFKHNLVLQASYPFTPLLSGSLALMYLPKVNGLYFGPSLSYSMAENIDASFYLQKFKTNLKGFEDFNMAFLRIKYSF
jgi:hypothetical protein